MCKARLLETQKSNSIHPLAFVALLPALRGDCIPRIFFSSQINPQNFCFPMAEKVTSEKITSSADFSAIWKAALVEFHANTDLSLANETKLLDLQNIDDLIIYLKNEYAEYDKDSASSSFTSAVKSSLGSLSLLLTVGDKAAGNVSWSLALGVALALINLL
jgi:hypothetical protein